MAAKAPEVGIVTGHAIAQMFKSLQAQGITCLLLMFDKHTEALEVLCSETNDPEQVKTMAKAALEAMREPNQLPDVPKQVWQQ